MKRIIIILAVISAVFFISSCNMMAGSGVLVDSEYQNKDFTKVAVSSVCELTITEGDDYSTVITCDDNIQPYLLVTEINGLLEIGLVPHTVYNNITLRAVITMPVLDSIALAEASKGSITGFNDGNDLSVSVSGASTGNFDFISIDDIAVEVSGASSLNLSAQSSVGNIKAVCSGASTLDMRDCSSVDADVSISGASRMWVNLNGDLTGEVTGASSVYYNGTPYVSGLSISDASNLSRY